MLGLIFISVMSDIEHFLNKFELFVFPFLQTAYLYPLPIFLLGCWTFFLQVLHFVI